MRRALSIVRTTALEVLSEPLTLLVMLAALALTVLAPAFHYHQFGDPTRMARDAGFSALFTGGSVLAVFGTIRAFRREIESGTLEMVLSHPVSRTAFFLSKTAGVFLAYLTFAVVVFGTMSVIYAGAFIGGAFAKRTGDIARLFGPCFAGGVGVLVLPLIIAAALNRFARFRFVLSASVVALSLAVVGFGGMTFLLRGNVLCLLPAAVLILFPAVVLMAAAAAFSVRWKANVAASGAGVVFALMVPAVGNYYLTDALSGGGSLPWTYVGIAAAVTLPAVAAFLLSGVSLINGRDLSWMR